MQQERTTPNATDVSKDSQISADCRELATHRDPSIETLTPGLAAFRDPCGDCFADVDADDLVGTHVVLIRSGNASTFHKPVRRDRADAVQEGSA